MTIYIVVGTNGTRRDCFEWISKCFINYEEAKKHKQICTTYAKNNIITGNHGRVYLMEQRKKSPDPHFKFNYSETNYNIISEELVIDNFMKEILLKKDT